jgi:hypothetical protein
MIGGFMAMDAFEKWWIDMVRSPDDYTTKPRAEIALAAWEAATLAERERCEQIADELKYEAPTSQKHFSYNKACDEIIAAIRKGEGV